LAPRLGFFAWVRAAIADYLGSYYVAIAELVSFDLTLYGNFLRKMGATKARPSCEKDHADWIVMKASLRGRARLPLLNRDPDWLHEKLWVASLMITARFVHRRGIR
jgi:hypothetical protein